MLCRCIIGEKIKYSSSNGYTQKKEEIEFKRGLTYQCDSVDGIAYDVYIKDNRGKLNVISYPAKIFNMKFELVGGNKTNGEKR